MENKKSHWENVFATKQPNEVSWTQEYPKTAMVKISKNAKIKAIPKA